MSSSRRPALPVARKCADCPASAIQPAEQPTYCTRCWQRRRRQGLLPPGSVADERRHAYYAAAHEDPEFVAAFKALYAQMFPAFAKPFADPLEWAKALRQADVRGAKPGDDRAISDFCTTWSLPLQDAPQEIWASFYAANQGASLYLRARWDGHLEPPVGPGAIDPLLEDAGELQRRKRAALAAGWKELPFVYRDPDTLRRVMRYTYLAAQGDGWAEIKRSEEAQGRTVTSEESIRSGAVSGAKALGIALPKLKRGRPQT